MHFKESVAALWKRRWALLFLNLVAGLSAAPFLYWTCIFMRIVLNAAHEAPTLLGLNFLNALTGWPLLGLAALGLGGCLSALRKILAGGGGFVPRHVLRGMGACAKTSLLAGGLLGLSLGVLRVGMVNLHALPLSGAPRCAGTALLALQFLAALPLCLLAITREDSLQRRPLRALAAAGALLARRPLRWYALLALTALPVLLLFQWQPPLLTLLGFLLVELLALTPMMLAWQIGSRTQDAGGKGYGLSIAMAAFLALDILALLLPFLGQGEPLGQIQATLRETLAFISRQALLEADNGTLRELLAASGVWPLLLAALLGGACCVMVAYVCACYRFRLRALLFAAAVLLQVLPMLASYASLEKLLLNLNLRFSSLVLGLCWALLYILIALLLYRRFARLLPLLQQNREKYPGVRLFFYYAIPRARLHVIALIALGTLGCWNDALAPFWFMRSMGAFSVGEYVWQSLSGGAERLVYAAAAAAAFGVFLGVLRIYGREERGA